jgi:ABC-type lipoprotein release transport system permease subunit
VDIGVRRALGASRAWVTLVQGLEAGFVALPAAVLGALVGALVAVGPTTQLLRVLDELPPGAALLAPLCGCVLVAFLVPVLAAVWPAWRAARRPPVILLRGAELGSSRDPGRRRWRPGGAGLAALGARLVAARRIRLSATLVVLAASSGFILLMLALATELSVLQADPGSLGRRYQLTASLPASAAPRVRALPGVSGAAPRYEVVALDSFSLGQTIDVIAFPGDHTRFEAPPLASGQRLHGAGEAEVGTGLAEVLGLQVGSTLAVALPDGPEMRLRVAGVVRSLDHDGRVAYVPAATLLAAEPSAPEQLAVDLRPGASVNAVSAGLMALGASSTKSAAGAVAKGGTLVRALTAILRAVAIVDALVCLYALAQALSLTVQERRGTIAVLRATGAGSPAVRRLLLGAAGVVALPAVLAGIVLERLVLGPAMSGLADRYVALPLGAGPVAVAIVVLALSALAAAAALWVARQTTREAIVQGLP